MKVQFDLNPGPLFGRPIIPDDGNWVLEGVYYAINIKDGTWFTINDVAADGTVTLHQPTDNWNRTLPPLLQSSTPVPATPALVPAAAAAAAASLPLAAPPPIVASGITLVPSKADIAKYGMFAPNTVPQGSADAAS